MIDEDGVDDAPHFVWVQTYVGPKPQVWRELYFGLNDWKKAMILQLHKITEQEAGLPIDILASKYPLQRRG